MSGHFISIDGIEGAGKSTQMAFINQYLQQRNIPTLLTREPGGSPMAEKIRNLLLDNTSIMDYKTELLLMFAARNDHIQTTIKPALTQGFWVLSDRFSDASYAYQGGGRGLSLDYISQVNSATINGFCPDLSLFLDIPIEVVIQRITLRGQLDRFEQEDKAFFHRVRQVFLARAKQAPKRIKLIDANRDISSVQVDITTALSSYITHVRGSTSDTL